jgi:hypothetical protein
MVANDVGGVPSSGCCVGVVTDMIPTGKTGTVRDAAIPSTVRNPHFGPDGVFAPSTDVYYDCG